MRTLTSVRPSGVSRRRPIRVITNANCLAGSDCRVRQIGEGDDVAPQEGERLIARFGWFCEFSPEA
jgi:hypothetical protein